MSARRLSAEERRGQLVAAALRLFSQQGVAATTVDDIVREAGVAKGTFYLYFKTKPDVMNAVVEDLVDEVVARIAAAVARPDLGAVEKLHALARSFMEMADEPHEVELIAFFHRAENRDVHDAMAERIGPALVPLVAEIVSQGVAEGAFDVDEPELAAGLVVLSISAIEPFLGSGQDIAPFAERLMRFVLRGLGYAGA